MYPEIPLPPKPILTRWGTWLEAVEYYAEHIDSINNVLLALDSEDAVSIDTAKTVTCDISVKNDLAHIQHTFSCIIKTLKSLQNRHLSLSESFEIINSTVEQLNRGRGKVADAVRAKVDTVLSKNPGYEELQKVVAVMSGESTVKINLDLSPADIVKLNYVPVTSCDVERSFSQYKSILRDNRRRFTFQHLKEMFVTYCYVYTLYRDHFTFFCIVVQYVIHISPSGGLNTCRLLTYEYRLLQKKHYSAFIPQMSKEKNSPQYMFRNSSHSCHYRRYRTYRVLFRMNAVLA
ncbi:hypothetical protein ANN_24041 [Periplaneta americana]|uniref:Uncharacterized protein n=1 Tax=Periplaneta americana TaxID=6978 RepID=A0ABQ8S2B3_PERAM|nr:hypothetical protein ANN_24041 [Periplaneta americana]